MLILNISMQPIEDKERELEAKLDKEIKDTGNMIHVNY